MQQCGVSVPDIVGKLEATGATDLTSACVSAGAQRRPIMATHRRRPGHQLDAGRGTLVAELRVAYVVSKGRPGHGARTSSKLRPPVSRTLTQRLDGRCRTEADHDTIAAGRVDQLDAGRGRPGDLESELRPSPTS